MLIDGHVHLNDDDESRNRPVERVAGDLLAAMAANGVGHGAVLPSHTVALHRPHVEQVLEPVESYGSDWPLVA